MLKIRLRRVGKRNQPSYRIVVVEHTAPIQGSYHEALGNYNPRARQFTVKNDRVLYWLDHGAQPSERMAKLLTSAGVKHKLIKLPDYTKKPARSPKKESTQAKAPVSEATKETDDMGEIPETPAQDGSSTEAAPEVTEVRQPADEGRNDE